MPLDMIMSAMAWAAPNDGTSYALHCYKRIVTLHCHYRVLICSVGEGGIGELRKEE